MAENVTREEIAELVGFVREEASELEVDFNDVPDAVSRAQRLCAIAEKLPALLAERDRFVSRPDDRTWFWGIVDRAGFADVPSDERGALAQIVAGRDRLAAEVERLTKERDEMESSVAELECRLEGVVDDGARVARQNAAMREALESLLPAARAWEFAETRTYCYGDGRTEPFEWGLDIQFQQTRDAMPADQFATAVEVFHAEADEEEADLPSRRARAALAQLDAPLADGRRDAAVARALFRDAEIGAAGGKVNDAPGHTDLMISPEAIDEALAANPLPEELANPSPLREDICVSLQEEVAALRRERDKLMDAIEAAEEIMKDCQTVERAVEGLVMFIKTGVRLHQDSSAVTDTEERAHRLGSAARAFVEKHGGAK